MNTIKTSRPECSLIPLLLLLCQLRLVCRAEVVKAITSLGKAYFPETTASATIINAPWIFSTVFNIISPLLTPVRIARWAVSCVLAKGLSSLAKCLSSFFPRCTSHALRPAATRCSHTVLPSVLPSRATLAHAHIFAPPSYDDNHAPKVMRKKVCILGSNFAAGFEAHSGVPAAALPAYLGGATSDAQCPEPARVPAGGFRP